MKKPLNVLLLACLLWQVTPAPAPIYAADALVGTGSAGSCTDAALDAGLAVLQASGGTLTFNCGGSATIVLATQKILSSSAPVTIDGGGLITLDADNLTRHFVIESPTHVILKGLTVTKGTAAGGPAAVLVRGGAQLDVKNSNFNSNYSGASSGGAIGGEAGSGILVEGSVFSGNGARLRGGAIWSAGFTDIADSTFEFNGADEGGAVALSGQGIINRSHFRSNNTSATGTNAGGGGAIWSSGDVQIIGSDILSNVADYGGGISVFTGTLTLQDSTLGYNVAARGVTGCAFCLGGGGMAIRTGTVLVTNSLIEHNRADHVGTSGGTSGAGGGIYSSQGQLWVLSSTVRLNFAQGSGGGVFGSGFQGGVRDYLGSIDIDNSWFFSNTAVYGAGLYLQETYYRHGGLHRTVFEQNATLDFGQGGGVYDISANSSSMTDMSFLDNRATYGGAIFSEQLRASYFVMNATFSGNRADHGGGIFYVSNGTSSSDNRYYLNHATFTGNRAVLAGSALFATGTGGRVLATNTAFGPSLVGGNCMLTGSIVFTASNSLSTDATCGGAEENAAPKLGPLIEAGPLVGSTGHQRQLGVHVPQAGSPLLDKAPSCGTTEDQRGLPRPQDGDGNGNASCDIGAVERQPNEGAPPTLTPTPPATTSGVRQRVFVPILQR